MVNHFISSTHLIRQRTNELLASAAKNPIIFVCAGAGCGKTQAVLDFTKQHEELFFWVQISERDNSVFCLWENIIASIESIDSAMAEQCRDIGFPDTDEKIERFVRFSNDTLNNPHIIVWDDIHLLKEPSVLYFAETIINAILPNKKMILIGRDVPEINIKVLDLKGYISNIREADLNFTENEVTDFFRKRRMTVDSHTIHEIYTDTKGWAFAINLIARSLERLPKYFGYIQNTFKKDIFELMEAESWNLISGQLKRFLVKLSLIDHLSAELVELIAADEINVLSELRNASTYIRFDSSLGTYLIHHLFLNLLNTSSVM